MANRTCTALVVTALVVPGLALASHGDGSYDIDLVSHLAPPAQGYRPRDAQHDVLILPPGHGQLVNGNGVLAGGDVRELTPFESSYVAAVEDSVQAWRDGLSQSGPGWLRDGFVIRAYVVGRDEVPPEVASDPDTVIAMDEWKDKALGVAFRGLMLAGKACVVLNSKMGSVPMSFTYEDMFNVNAQEFGHCLGLNHVTENHPLHDAMSGAYAHTVGSPGAHLHCVSNLDVAGVAAAVQHHFGRPPGPDAVSMPVDAYATTDCDSRRAP